MSTWRLKSRDVTRLRHCAITFVLAVASTLGGLASHVQAQDTTTQRGWSSNTISAVPNRPSASTTAETVQRGVFEVEFGTELTSNHQDLNTLNKFGLTQNLEVRLANNPFERQGGSTGVGDTGAGLKLRSYQTKAGAKALTLSALYMFFRATGSPGLGTGSDAHLVQGLASIDLGKEHFDLNEGAQFQHRLGTGGYDRAYFTALSLSRPIKGEWNWTEEVAGWSTMNTDRRATLSILTAVSWNLRPTLVLDSGLSIATYSNLPRIMVIAGVTFSVAELYSAH